MSSSASSSSALLPALPFKDWLAHLEVPFPIREPCTSFVIEECESIPNLEDLVHKHVVSYLVVHYSVRGLGVFKSHIPQLLNTIRQRVMELGGELPEFLIVLPPSIHSTPNAVFMQGLFDVVRFADDLPEDVFLVIPAARPFVYWKSLAVDDTTKHATLCTQYYPAPCKVCIGVKTHCEYLARRELEYRERESGRTFEREQNKLEAERHMCD